MRILVVCLGNICRSPTAAAALREAAAEAGLEVDVDSAGTAAYNIGEPPDRRMREAAAAVGLTLTGRARQVREGDFARYDIILAMDRSNLAHLEALAPDTDARGRLALFRSFDPEAGGNLDVSDPYGGGRAGFDRVVAIARRGARGVIEAIRDDDGRPDTPPDVDADARGGS